MKNKVRDSGMRRPSFFLPLLPLLLLLLPLILVGVEGQRAGVCEPPQEAAPSHRASMPLAIPAAVVEASGGTSQFFAQHRMDFYGAISSGPELILDLLQPLRPMDNRGGRGFIMIDVGAGPDPTKPEGDCIICDAIKTFGCRRSQGDAFYGFEADPNQFSLLGDFLFAHPSGGYAHAPCVSILPLAMSNTTTRLTFTIAHAPNTNSLDFDRISRPMGPPPVELDHLITKEGLPPRRWLPQGKAQLQVQAVTLDDFLTQAEIPYVDFLKVDTEGHDALVLQGGRDSFSQGKVGAVVAEVSDKMNRHTWAACYDQAVPVSEEEYFRTADITLKGMVDFMTDMGYEAYLLSYALGGLRIDGPHWDSNDLEFCRDPGRLAFGGHSTPCWADVAFIHKKWYQVVPRSSL